MSAVAYRSSQLPGDPCAWSRVIKPWSWLHYLRLFVAPFGLTADTDMPLVSGLGDTRFYAGAATMIALGAIDNLGKGAAAQAVQNANLMTGQAETAGLGGLPFL